LTVEALRDGGANEPAIPAKLESVPIVKLARAVAQPIDATLLVEQSVLGALLVDGKAFKLISWLRVEHFASEGHRKIFQGIRDCADDDGVVDLITVTDRVARRGGGELDGEWAAYLGNLAQNTPSALNIRRYAELVVAKWRARELASVGAELVERANAPGGDVHELRRQVEERLARIAPPAPRTAQLDWKTLSLKEPPPRRWVEKGWVGFNITMLVGPGGIGKTLLAQELASSWSLGRSLIDEVAGSLKVLMWACEDDHDELWRRQVAIARMLGTGLDVFQNLVLVPRHGLENALVVAEMGRLMYTPVIEELRHQAGDVGAEVVVLDNVAQLFGASENDRHAVTGFMNALAGALPGRAIVLLAHPARSAGSEFSGSSAWENVARTRLYLGTKLPDQKLEADEQPQEDVRYLARRKSNYSSKDWRRLTFKDGVLVPDPVEPTGGIVSHLRDKAAERAVLGALERLQAMGIDATEGTRSPRFLPRLMHEYQLTEGCNRAELAVAMRRLMVEERLVKTEVGKYQNRSPMYGLRLAMEAHK
jgi:RecA-family ATPase